MSFFDIFAGFNPLTNSFGTPAAADASESKLDKAATHIFDVYTGESSDKRKDELYGRELDYDAKKFNQQQASDDKKFERALTFDAQSRLDEAKIRAQDKADERESRRLDRLDEIAREERKYKADREERMLLIAAGKQKDAEEAAKLSREQFAKDQLEREKINAQILIQTRQESINNARQFRNGGRVDAGQLYRETSFRPSITPFVPKKEARPVNNPFKKDVEAVKALAGPALELATGFIGGKLLGGLKSGLLGDLGGALIAKKAITAAQTGTGTTDVSGLAEHRQSATQAASEITAGSSTIRDTSPLSVSTQMQRDPGFGSGHLHRRIEIY